MDFVSERDSTARLVWKSKGMLPLKSVTLPDLTSYSLTPPSPFNDRETSSNSNTFWSPLNIRNQSIGSVPRHRDTPIYTEQGSPLIGTAYYTSQSTHTPDFPRIINDYEITDNEDVEEQEFQETQSESTVTMRDSIITPHRLSAITEVEWRDSTLSFQCAGEDEDDSIFTSEAAWLRSPLNKWNNPDSESLPHILAQSMPLPSRRRMDSWISEEGSCIEDGEDVFACATALAPSKAQVVDVNVGKGLAIIVPQRTSSLGNTFPDPVKPEFAGRSSWMTFGEDSASSFIEPSSPSETSAPRVESSLSVYKTWSPPQPSHSQFPASPPISPKSSISEPLPYISPSYNNTSLHNTISSLENHLISFPSNMLLSDSACTRAMREYLQNRNTPQIYTSSTFNGTNNAAPPSPAYSEDSVFLLQTQSSPYILQGLNPTPSSNRSTSSTSSLTTTLPQTQTPTAKPPPNLEPIRRIFPNTSNLMCSSLYAHLIAYIFVTKLSTSTLPSSNNPNHTFRFPLRSRSKSSSGSLRSKGQYRNNRDERDRTSGNIPYKAASLLGMHGNEFLAPAQGSMDSDEEEKEKEESWGVSATETMEEELRGVVGRLVDGMVGESNSGGFWADGVGFRCLVEVVKGIESL